MTKFANALTLKSEESNASEIVTKALADLQKTVDDRIKAVEEKSAANDNKALVDRLAALENKANRPGGTVDKDAQAEAEKKAFANFLRTGSLDDIKAAGGEIETKAASSGSDSAGGYMVLPSIDFTIRNLMTDLSPMRALADVVSIGTDRYERFYSMGKRGAQWVSERDDRPQDTARPELIKHSYGVAELYAAPAATRHLLDDAATDIASWLINNATHDFAETEGESFLRGMGADGRPKGLLDYPTAATKDFERAWGTFQYIPAGHASAPTDAQLVAACINIVAKLRKPYKPNAKWLMNSTTTARLMGIVDDNGRRLWAPTGNLIEGEEHTQLVYQVEIDEGMDDIGAGKFPIAFGDFKQGYVIVDRQGIHVEQDRVTQKGRVLFDTYKRVGGGAGDFNAIKFIKVAAS